MGYRLLILDICSTKANIIGWKSKISDFLLQFGWTNQKINSIAFRIYFFFQFLLVSHFAPKVKLAGSAGCVERWGG